MKQLTVSGRGLLGFEPIRRGFGGLGVVLQHHAEEEGWSLFGVFTAQQWIPARLLTHRKHLYITHNNQKMYIYIFFFTGPSEQKLDITDGNTLTRHTDTGGEGSPV